MEITVLGKRYRVETDPSKIKLAKGKDNEGGWVGIAQRRLDELAEKKEGISSSWSVLPYGDGTRNSSALNLRRAADTGNLGGRGWF